MSSITKVCRDCKCELPTESFGSNKGTKDGLRYYCKPCNNKKSSNYQKDNRDRRNSYQKEWNRKNPEKQRRSHIKTLYKLGWETYVEMYKTQQGRCKICSSELKLHNTQENSKRTIAVDHCHSTNKVRGLLCSKCNKGLGLFDDNIELLKIAINYLEESHGNK